MSLTDGGRTGWPAGLLQDDSKKLSQWFAGRPGARYTVRKVLLEMINAKDRKQNERPKSKS